MGKSLRKTISTWKTVIKIFRKHQNIPTGTHKKKQILFHSFPLFERVEWMLVKLDRK